MNFHSGSYFYFPSTKHILHNYRSFCIFELRFHLLSCICSSYYDPQYVVDHCIMTCCCFSSCACQYNVVCFSSMLHPNLHFLLVSGFAPRPYIICFSFAASKRTSSSLIQFREACSVSFCAHETSMVHRRCPFLPQLLLLLV